MLALDDEPPPYEYDENGAPILSDGFEYLCYEHRVIKTSFLSYCPECYPVMVYSAGPEKQFDLPFTYGFGSVGPKWGDDFTADSSGSVVVPSTTGNYLNIVFRSSSPVFSSSDVSEYPYSWISFRYQSDLELSWTSLSSNLPRDVIKWISGVSESSPTTLYKFRLEDNGDGSKTLQLLVRNLVDRPYFWFYIPVPSSGWPQGTVVTITDVRINPVTSLDDDPPPASGGGGDDGPMSPPTDSDKWLDEQYSSAVNPELNGEMDKVGEAADGIGAIEDDMFSKLEEHSSNVDPSQFSFDGGLVSALGWIGGIFTDCFDALGPFKAIVSFPMFIGLALLFIGRGNQAMTSTAIRHARGGVDKKAGDGY